MLKSVIPVSFMKDFPNKTYFSIGLLSMGVIAFELMLIQLFSITQWYHFAYMVISVAMLGFGAAGTFITLFEEWFLERYRKLFPLLLLMSGLSMAVVVRLSNGSFFRFDTYLIFMNFRHIGRLVFTYLLFFIPFLLAALALGLTYVKYVRQIGALYFSDLLGSGTGAVLGLVLMWLFFPWEIPGWVSLLPVAAGILALDRKSGVKMWSLAGLSIAVSCLSIVYSPRPQLSEYKSLPKILLLPDASIEMEKNSPYGLIQVVSSPALRYAPGLSLSYQGTVPVRKVVCNNGNWIGSVIPKSPPDSVPILDYTTGALPYFLRDPERVLVLNAGTGEQVVYALAKNTRQITMQEANPVLLDLLRKELATETDSLLYDSALTVYDLEARTLLYTDTNHYELIELPVVSVFGGTSGLDALQEQYLMTREAFGEMWDKLQPDGMISISSWMDYPVRNPIKILATLVETLETKGVENIEEHLLGIRSWGMVTFLLKRSPYTATEIAKVRGFCRKMQFDPLILQDLQVAERDQYNQLQDTLFFDYLDAILSPDRSAFYHSYTFNVRPATDDRPYFSQFIRWKNLSTLSETFNRQGLPFLEIGYLIVVLTFFQMLIIAVVLILLPLSRIRSQVSGKWRLLFYFGGIGLGYMFVEIVLIQRFILYFGNPIYATAAVIACLLVASGAGSYYSSRLMAKGYRVWIGPVVIILLLFLLSGILQPVLLGSIGRPLTAKLIILLLIVVPLGFVMGIPFPTGMTDLSKKGKQGIPWAWGINGYVSVISTALATIIAVELGFWWVMMLAAAGYFLAVLSKV